MQRSSNNPNQSHNDSNHGGHYLEPRVVNVRHFRLESVGSTSSCPHTPVSPSLPSSNMYNFDSVDIERNKCEKRDSMTTPNTPSPVYMNVATNAENTEDPSGSQNAYLYLTEKADKHYPAPLILPSNNQPNNEEQSTKNLKYITLDFDSKISSPILKTPTEEDGLSPKYTMIDLQRTWALSQSTKPNIENDIGCVRRTRHNSNLFGVNR